MAWHIEAFERQKKLPDLKSLLIRHQRKDSPQQTIEQQRAVVNQLSAQLGTPVRKVRLVPKPVVH